MDGKSVLRIVAAPAAVLMMMSCSEGPTASTTEAKSNDAATVVQPVTAKTAFWEMYKSAHAWAKDKVPLSLEGKAIPGYKSEAGKAAQWVGIFGSPSLHQAVTFTYTIAAVPPGISKGVSVGRAIPWAGPQREAMPFETSDFKVDSDVAFKTASDDAKAWLAKHPDQDFSMSLGSASRFSGPVWSCQWGTKKLGYLAFVSAVTGDVEKPKK